MTQPHSPGTPSSDPELDSDRPPLTRREAREREAREREARERGAQEENPDSEYECAYTGPASTSDEAGEA